MAERLTTKLAQTGEFQVIERSSLEAALKELNLSASGVVDEKTALKTGRVLGAQVAVTGTITRVDGKFEVNARVIDVETGGILTGSIVLLDEHELSVRGDQDQAVYVPPQPRPDLAAQQQQQPRQKQTPPKGWEEWPGWQGRYGSYSYSGGKLTYTLDTRQNDFIDDPQNGYYPGVVLSRAISGKSWTVDAKVSYYLPEGNGRWFSFFIWLGRDGTRPSMYAKGNAFFISSLRAIDVTPGADRFVFLYHPGQAKGIDVRSDYSYIRFKRSGGMFRGYLSRDGKNYEEILAVKVPPASANLPQKIVLGGQSFLAFGSYAEYEYIKFNGKPLF